MHIALLNPYHTGSHAAWAEGYARYSRHQVTLLSMSGCFWKWRMHGAAVTLAREFMARFPHPAASPDLILATDMLDLSVFLAMTRSRTCHTPAVLYLHENQLTYPLAPGEKRDLHYGFINFTSMLAADHVLFNSPYHLETFYDELPRMLKHFPDYNELWTIEALRRRSEVLPVGIDLRRFDPFRPSIPPNGRPLILWNHRWEYDKNPAEFFQAVCRLADEGLEFDVAVAGENFRQQPREFEEARQRLGQRLVHFGFANRFEDYARLLWRADLLPVTSHHEFFGVSVVEAIYCDTFPLLPDRLTYPYLVGETWRGACIYANPDDLLKRLRYCVEHIQTIRRISLRHGVAAYDWQVMAPAYDGRLEQIWHSPTKYVGE